MVKSGELQTSVSISDKRGLYLPDLDTKYYLPEIKLLEEGIEAHKRKDFMTAWECFNTHADLGDTTAKYWKGYYLWEGYVDEKDRAKASELFKEAADDGLPEAQLKYAFSLVEKSRVDRGMVIEYLTKAAENNNTAAQFHLGDLYVNGNLNVPKDKQKGIKYLKLAALSKHPKALETLQKMNINLYNHDSIN